MLVHAAKLFKVGSQSRSCTKTITGTAGYKCPAVLTKHTWYMRGLPHANCNDKFTVTQSGNKLTVKRVDAGGRDCHGWGMRLQFKCTKVSSSRKAVNSALLKGRVTQSSEGWAGIQTTCACMRTRICVHTPDGVWAGRPSRAVDGNTNQRYPGNSCTHTQAGSHEW